MSEPSARYTYGIDPSDVITHVDTEWLRFAQDNEALELTAAYVLGKPIWRFIFGADVQRIYWELFRHMRSRPTEHIIPFRCDSPTVIRHMELTVRSLVNGAIEFEGRLLQREAREGVNALSRRARRSNESIPICSICRRFLSENEWIEVGSVIVRRRLFNAEPIPRLEETVCPDCRSQFS